MHLIEKYRFTLTHTTAGNRVCTPVVSDLQIVGKQVSRFAWRKELQTPLLFEGEDYTWIKAIEDGVDRCEKVEILIEENCAGSWATFYEGYMSMDDGQWDTFRCRVTIKVRIDDEYSCIFENWKEEKNILTAIGAYTATGLTGSIDEEECTSAVVNVDLLNIPTDNSCWPDANEWTIIENEFTGTHDNGDGTYNGFIRTVWQRERVDGSVSQPVGSGWVSIGGNSWVRELDTEYLGETTDLGVPSVLQEWQLTGNVEIDNARRLESVLDLFNPCPSYTFRSDFFRINAGTLPATDPYTAAQNGFDEILLWQKSDVVRPGADYNATKGNTTLEKLLSWLRTMFQVEWKVEGGNVIRIEHISYFEGDNGLNLVTGYPTQIANKNAYTYNTAKKPKYERFSWMDETRDYFEGNPIVYDTACTDKEENSEVFYRADEVSTDIAFLNDNEEEASLLGFVLAAAFDNGSGGYWLNVEEAYLNGHLSWTKLHANYYTYSRPQLNGTMNEVATTFDSVIPSKKQEVIALQTVCSTFASFDPEKRVNTELGWGELGAWTYSTKNCLLTLEIVHE